MSFEVLNSSNTLETSIFLVKENKNVECSAEIAQFKGYQVGNTSPLKDILNILFTVDYNYKDGGEFINTLAKHALSIDTVLIKNRVAIIKLLCGNLCKW